MRVLMTGLMMGESPRWHEGRLWFCDWMAQEIIALDLDGKSEVVLRVPFSLPFCIDWLPDGRLLVISGQEGKVLRQEPDGSLVTHADLGHLPRPPWNEIITDAYGNAYANCIAYDFPGGEPAPGYIALVRPDGSAVQVADGLAFPNGMAIVGDTLIVAESHGGCLTAFTIQEDGTLADRRVWADLGDDAPDGICADPDGNIWYGSVPGQQCVLVKEGGEVLRTIELDRGCFACALGGDTLFMVTADWSDLFGSRSGQIVAAFT
ncbi:SMP-30/gluconolactonase/LRE family protein [Nonomuraea sp. NPDC050556]|uniref:SMP-30/gluconolactonase/LRE family protein n=1 Tax=Nonomuraea sp. NPDC050556 TaxID=3364369 RepID=UPI00379361FC